ncbi:MAG: DUF4345 family protein [Alphaproteobacteria bacterium]|nr:DUF4345 family protein [Alphaproteobacteria bacterium]MCB9699567.1 DUF4345 family protein [Alphaproteobacteria bacterium]
MVRALLGLAVLVYAAIGVWTLIDPVGPMADVGVAVTDARGLVELRAMYGGLELGMAAFLGWCLTDAARARIGLVAATLTLLGLGSVRLVSWVVLQPPGSLLPALFTVELGGALAGALALWRTR